MIPEDVSACGDIIDSIPFYNDYGVRGSVITRALSDSMEDGEQVCRVAVLEERVVGFAWLMKRGGFGRSAYLRLLAVTPQAQGHGVGRALMIHLESEWLNPHGLMLLVTEDNGPAVAFYTALGYVQRGRLPNYVKSGRTECLFFKPGQ